MRYEVGCEGEERLFVASLGRGDRGGDDDEMGDIMKGVTRFSGLSHCSGRDLFALLDVDFSEQRQGSVG